MSGRQKQSGYTLIEVILVVVILGILAAVAMKSMTQVTETSRTEETKLEMIRLAIAIAGDPDQISGGVRSDYGYIGDVGSLPPNWDDLVTNPGYATWDGPYIQDEFATASANIEFKLDAWGTTYGSPAAAAFSSTGGSITITRKVANSTADLLYNSITCSIIDLNLSPPGPIWRDSVKVLLIHPDGSGSVITRTAWPTANGLIKIDSVPIGRHRLQVIIIPENDTLRREISINPGRDTYIDLQHFADIW